MNKDTKVTLAFFKTFEKDNDETTILGKLVGLYTHGPYSHVAIIIEDIKDGLLNESTQWEASPTSGYVKKSKHMYDEVKWDYIDINIKDINNTIEFLNSVLGNKYDYAGILGFILPIQDRSNRWFCSELASNILKIDGYEPMWYIEPSSVSPNKLYKLLKDPQWK